MTLTNTPSARIDTLLRYPVKSMLGEEIGATSVGERGFLGDRAYALIDQARGKVVSAKNPRLWNVLLMCRAAFVEEPAPGAELPPVRITLPDGERIESDDPAVHDTLSRAVGRDVRLETEPPEGAVLEQLSPVIEGIPEQQEESLADTLVAIVAPGTFFDAAPLHVVTTATLDRLRDLAPASNFTARRFRPNIVMEVEGGTGFVEDRWVGRTLGFGTVEASVFLSAPRCVMTTLAQADLPRDPKVLQTIAHNNRFDIPGLGPSSCVGVYALVATSGSTKLGDAVAIA
jgi:uncharacterized protein YcbX